MKLRKPLKKRVFYGWIDATDESELPSRVGKRTWIVFGGTKWRPTPRHPSADSRCRITVEWEKPEGDK